MSAEIETLIRQALARQNAFDPSIRQGIYQSSRNALAKMIAKHGALAPSAIEERYHSLEATISKIEQEFTVPPPQPQQSPPAVAPETPVKQSSDLSPPPSPATVDPVASIENAAQAEVEPTQPQIGKEPTFGAGETDFGTTQTVSGSEPVAPVQPQVQAGQAVTPAAVETVTGETTAQTNPTADPVQYADPTPQYARSKRPTSRLIVWLIVLVMMALVAWLSYMVATSFLEDGSGQAANNNKSANNEQAAAEGYITILEPSAPGTLNTSGSATAEIVTDTADPFIRIMSVRAEANREQSAKPILLELAPGVLSEIAGKRATVEILAKSGDTSPATFSVSCEFGDLGQCSRKRFRVGLQPEAIVFSIAISSEYQEGKKAYLAINTDVTSASAITGKGAQVDIIYARLRPIES